MNGILQNIILVQLRVNLWSAHCKLDLDELLNVGGTDAQELHRALACAPKEVVSLGSKRIFPQDQLRLFGSLKYHAEKLLRANGFHSFRAFVVPASKYAEIKAQLETYQREFDVLRGQLLATYDKTLSGWASSFPEWEEVIRKAAPRADQVYEKLHFSFSAFHIAPVAGSDSETDTGEDSLVRGLGDELMDEAVAEAQSFYDDCVKGRSSISRVSLRRLSDLGSKLDGFRFIDTRIGPLADKLSAIATGVPQEGKITGSYYDAISSVVLTIITGHALDYGTAGADANDVSDDFLETLDTGTSEPPPDTPAESEEEERDQACFLFE